MRLIIEKKLYLAMEFGCLRKMMRGKYFCFLAAVFLAGASARLILEKDVRDFQLMTEEFLEVEPRIFESKILEAIRKLKDFIKNGDVSNGVSPLDPFFISYRDFDFIIKETELEGFFENVTLSNFSDFEVQHVEFKLLPLHFKIEILFKEFLADGRYKMVGNIFNEIPVNGKGHFISRTQDLSLFLYVKPNKVNSSLQIKDLMFESKMLSEKVNYTNEFESEEYQILDEDLTRHVLDRVQTEYLPSLVEMGKMLLNHFLLGYTSEEIMQFILDFLKKSAHSRNFL